MSKTLEHRTTKNHTRSQDLTVSLQFLKTAIETEIDRKIPRATWSDWCRRSIDGTSPAKGDRTIGISEAAMLWTMGGLYSYEARCYNGEAFKNLYPLCLSRVKEIFNV